jgi:hypothetical protein
MGELAHANSSIDARRAACVDGFDKFAFEMCPLSRADERLWNRRLTQRTRPALLPSQGAADSPETHSPRTGSRNRRCVVGAGIRWCSFALLAGVGRTSGTLRP